MKILVLQEVKIIVSWTTSTDNVYVRWRYEQGNYTSRSVEGAKSYEILDTIAGNYTIEVYSVIMCIWFTIYITQRIKSFCSCW